MNIRKNIDYSEMYENLDKLMARGLSPMELYCEIGKLVCQRTEKGAAVIASEYLNKNYPDVKGFSPRNLRRMRDFYRTYENHPALLCCALKLGWIQNVVIMEADLTMELREWYMKAAKQFGWSKTELIANITEEAHDEIALDVEEEAYCIVEENQIAERDENVQVPFHAERVNQQTKIIRWRLEIKRGRRRQCFAIVDNNGGSDGIDKILGKMYIYIQGLLLVEWYHKYHAAQCMKKETIALQRFFVYNSIYMRGVVQP